LIFRCSILRRARATASLKLDVPSENLVPLFDAIVAHLPGPEVDPDATLPIPGQ